MSNEDMRYENDQMNTSDQEQQDINAARNQPGQFPDQFAQNTPDAQQYAGQPQNVPPAQQGTDNPLMDSARQWAGEQVNQAIDQYANKLPGGEQYKDEAKQMAQKGLDTLEQQAEQHQGDIVEKLKNALGGLFGGGRQKQQ